MRPELTLLKKFIRREFLLKEAGKKSGYLADI